MTADIYKAQGECFTKSLLICCDSCYIYKAQGECLTKSFRYVVTVVIYKEQGECLTKYLSYSVQ